MGLHCSPMNNNCWAKRNAGLGCVQKPLLFLRIFRSGLVRGDTRMCTLQTDTKVALSSVCALQCLHFFTSLTCFFILQNMLSIFRIYINNNNNILVNHCKIMKTRYLDNKLIVSLYRGWFVFVYEWHAHAQSPVNCYQTNSVVMATVTHTEEFKNAIHENARYKECAVGFWTHP